MASRQRLHAVLFDMYSVGVLVLENRQRTRRAAFMQGRLRPQHHPS